MHEPIKVFISYSWTSPQHEEWVIELASRLRSDGVDAVLDKWDLREGQDKHAYMEAMINDPLVKKVLLIIDKKYTDKANQREGGVGTETLIISNEIYSSVSQEKFIPIVTEKDSDGNPYLPTFISSRIYIDFSDEVSFLNTYEKLLRTIYEKPLTKKPSIGPMPEFLNKETSSHSHLKEKIRIISQNIRKNSSNSNYLVDEFMANLFTEFLTFRKHNNTSWNMPHVIYERINSFQELKDIYIEFLDIACNKYFNLDENLIPEFLEKCLELKFYHDEETNRIEVRDEFKFIIHELFLSTLSIALNKQNYRLINSIFHRTYYNKSNYNNESGFYTEFFYGNITSIDNFYDEKVGKKYISPMADFILSRCRNNQEIRCLVTADYLAHLASFSLPNIDTSWFPLTYIYESNFEISIFQRLKSKKYLDEFKVIFNIQNTDELIFIFNKQKNYINNHRYAHSRGFKRVNEIDYYIRSNDIGTLI